VRAGFAVPVQSRWSAASRWIRNPGIPHREGAGHGDGSCPGYQDGGIAYLRAAPPDQPFFLWLHYVNPTPLRRAAVRSGVPRWGHVGPILPRCPDSTRREKNGQSRQEARVLVSQYDGEIASVDVEVGRVLGP